MKQFKNFFGLRDQQWSDDGQLIKKNSEHIWKCLKSGSCQS